MFLIREQLKSRWKYYLRSKLTVSEASSFVGSKESWGGFSAQNDRFRVNGCFQFFSTTGKRRNLGLYSESISRMKSKVLNNMRNVLGGFDGFKWFLKRHV